MSYVTLAFFTGTMTAYRSGATILARHVVVLNQSLSHRKDKVRRQILHSNTDRSSLYPSIRIEPANPCDMTCLRLMSYPIVCCLLAFLGLLCDIKIFVDNGNEHLKNDDYRTN